MLFLRTYSSSNDSDLFFFWFQTDLISMTKLWKFIVLSWGKESYEDTLTFAWLWEITYVTSRFTPMRYLILF